MLLEATLSELWTISKQGNFSPDQQECARAMFLLAPRWLWPEPAKCPGEKRLAPHSRPKIVRRRLEMVATGEWSSLLAELNGVAVYGLRIMLLLTFLQKLQVFLLMVACTCEYCCAEPDGHESPEADMGMGHSRG